MLLVTKGHPFDREPFLALFDADPGIAYTHVEQPEAQALLRPERAEPWDVVVFYDMPGVRFTDADPPVAIDKPPATLVASLEALLAAGKGLVFLHHAVAGWPAWPRYGEVIGARFHYRAADFAGRTYPDSGYLLDVSHHVEVVDPDHPVCAGLGAGFDLTDELYLFPVLTDKVLPLLRTTHDTTDPPASGRPTSPCGAGATPTTGGPTRRAATSWRGCAGPAPRRSPTSNPVTAPLPTATRTTGASSATPSGGRPHPRPTAGPAPPELRSGGARTARWRR